MSLKLQNMSQEYWRLALPSSKNMQGPQRVHVKTKQDAKTTCRGPYLTIGNQPNLLQKTQKPAWSTYLNYKDK